MLEALEAEKSLRELTSRIESSVPDCTVMRADGKENYGINLSSTNGRGPTIYFNLSKLMDFMDIGIEGLFEMNDIPFDLTYAFAVIDALSKGRLTGELVMSADEVVCGAPHSLDRRSAVYHSI